ncbi:hypothetical protein ACFYVL_18955 [Streptomyces sp. NPDC004111]|uniref:hypothetical protein n=1 Tax=Streptomyces sp. NPDC004111 TaxID=3364690 RepID=UPI00368E8254
MTPESAPPRENAAPPLDTTAELLTRFTAQLAAQLGRIAPDGSRHGGARSTPPAPAPA